VVLVEVVVLVVVVAGADVSLVDEVGGMVDVLVGAGDVAPLRGVRTPSVVRSFTFSAFVFTQGGRVCPARPGVTGASSGVGVEACVGVFSVGVDTDAEAAATLLRLIGREGLLGEGEATRSGVGIVVCTFSGLETGMLPELFPGSTLSARGLVPTLSADSAARGELDFGKRTVPLGVVGASFCSTFAGLGWENKRGGRDSAGLVSGACFVSAVGAGYTNVFGSFGSFVSVVFVVGAGVGAGNKKTLGSLVSVGVFVSAESVEGAMG
jgi:hypothetical protein